MKLKALRTHRAITLAQYEAARTALERLEQAARDYGAEDWDAIDGAARVWDALDECIPLDQQHRQASQELLEGAAENAEVEDLEEAVYLERERRRLDVLYGAARDIRATFEALSTALREQGVSARAADEAGAEAIELAQNADSAAELSTEMTARLAEIDLAIATREAIDRFLARSPRDDRDDAEQRIQELVFE